MKNVTIGMVASLMLFAVSFTYAKDKAFMGEIMDNQCAKMGSHDMMMKKEGIKTVKECTMGCVKMGGKYVLYNPTTKTVYELDDQTKPGGFAGEKVKVTGTLDKATKTIHVTDIQSGS